MVRKSNNKIKIIPLGGLEEIGKNMTLIEYKDEILVIDCGIGFPDDQMLGIDVVIPDITYLVKNKEKVKGIVVTHGHEDHIGAIPYFLKRLNVPVYGSKLTIGLVGVKLKEHRINDAQMINIEIGEQVKIGNFKVDFIRVNHSIPDACALAIHTPIGTIFHSGDFKIDYTPIDGKQMDLHKIAEIGSKGCLCLLCESTNVEKKGSTLSEAIVGKTLDDIFEGAEGKRILVATFASNIHRLQQIINSAVKCNRKVAVSGRSMVNIVAVSQNLNYLDIPKGTLIDLNEAKRCPDSELVIITTGSQGEPMSALSRMAAQEHRQIEIKKGDLIIISAHPIPGNEKLISRVIDQLFQRGAEVVYESISDIHVSGHACQNEIKLMHRLLKPKYFMPVHGEYRHLHQHAKLAEELGMNEEDIFMMSNGGVFEFNQKEAAITGRVPSGNVMIDGLGVGDVGNIVLRDRKHLSEDGLFIIVATLSKTDGTILSGPDIISRGFVYVREAEALMDEARVLIKDTLTNCQANNTREWSNIKGLIKDNLKNFLYEKTKRSPMILPILTEI